MSINSFVQKVRKEKKQAGITKPHGVFGIKLCNVSDLFCNHISLVFDINYLFRG